jgi:hypothetical protein
MAQAALANAKRSGRWVLSTAMLLILTTLVEILAMVGHPHAQDHDRLQATLQIIALSPLAGLIHGLAIGCSLLIAYCLGELLWNRMPAPLMRAAALVYAAGMVCWLTAATVDGWVLERLAASLAHDTAADLERSTLVFKLCMAWVVGSTNVGFVLTSVGIFIACAGLLRSGRAWQIAAAVGLIVGAALTLSIMAGHLSMDGHGAILAVGSQGLWFVSLGAVALSEVRMEFEPASTVSQ